MKRGSVLVFTGVVFCVLALYLLIFAYLPSNTPLQTTTSTATRQSSSSGNASTILNASKVYSQLGYPKVLYNSDHGIDLPIQYSPSLPNFTFGSYDVESAPVINFTEATHLAESKAALNMANYSLAVAEFEPGGIKNTAYTGIYSLAGLPSWNFWFAQVYHGYWLYGNSSEDATSEYVSLDAVTGSIITEQSFGTNQPTAGNYILTVNASQALAVVRGFGPNPKLPGGFTRGGNVTSISPRILDLPGLSLYTIYVAPGILEQDELCWVISLSYQGLLGTFYVDGQTGELLSASVGQENLPPQGTPANSVNTTLVYASAKNLTVSQETFQGIVAGLPYNVTAVVPRVIVARPGSTGSIEVNFSSNVSFSIVEYLNFTALPIQGFGSNGLPVGVTASYSNDTVVTSGAIPNATRSIFFTISDSAPAGTYLVTMSPVAPYYPDLVEPVSFLLTIWNGIGQWPGPPCSYFGGACLPG